MKRLTLSAILLAAASSASANEFAPAMQAYLENEVSAWASNPVLIAAVRAQNAHHAAIDQARIDALDTAWRAEVGAASTPTISPVLSNPAAEFLRKQVAESDGVITELFIMDHVGLNVAASAITSDMWQGDEAKFTESFGKGAQAVHIGEVEFDESSQTFQGQVSIPLVDPADGSVVGAMTIGLNAEALL